MRSSLRLARVMAPAAFLVAGISSAQEAALPWIPGSPVLVMGFHDDGTAGAAELREAMLFAAEVIEPFDRLDGLLANGEARAGDLLVALFARPDGSRGFLGFVEGRFEDGAFGALGSYRVGNRELFLVPGESEAEAELAMAVLGDEGLAFGNVASVLEAAERFEARPSDGAFSSWVDGVDRSGTFWGAASADWLGFESELDPDTLAAADVGGRSLLRSLHDVRGMSFSAAGLNVRLVTRAKDEKDAEILLDAIAAFVRGAGAGGPPEVRDVLGGTQADRVGAEVRLEIPLSASALERLQRSVAARNLFRWRVGEQSRERTGRPAAVVEALGISEGGQVADVGAGGGFFTVRLARHVGASGRVFAVDVSEGALSRLRERTARLDNVEVVHGRLDEPLLPKASLDAVLIVNAYHEMDEHESMLRHIRESLKPSGRLVLLEPYTTTGRARPRSEQEEDHTIAPELVAEDLTQAGFEILTREDEFIESTQPGRFEALVVGVAPAPF